MTLFIHAGLPKTGSSAIQTLMFAGRDVLARKGLRYWGYSERHNRPLQILFNAKDRDNPRREARQDGYGTPAAIRRSLTRLFAEPGSVLLSGEGITTLSTESLIELRDMAGRDVKVIVYVREPRSWFASGVQQRIKTGATLDRAVESRSFYRERLGNLIEAFGDNVDARLYRSSSDGKALMHDFMTALGLEPTLLDDLTVPVVNTSLSNKAVWFVEAVNRRLRDLRADGMQNALRNAASEMGGGSFKLPSDILDRLLSERADDIAWASELVGVDLLQFGENYSPGERVEYDPEVIEIVCRLSQQLHSNKVEAKKSAAEVMAREGNVDEARRMLRKTLALKPRDAAAQAKLAELGTTATAETETEGDDQPVGRGVILKAERKAQKRAAKEEKRQARIVEPAL